MRTFFADFTEQKNKMASVVSFDMASFALALILGIALALLLVLLPVIILALGLLVGEYLHNVYPKKCKISYALEH